MKFQTAKSWRGVQGRLRPGRTQSDPRKLRSLQWVLHRDPPLNDRCWAR